MVAGREFFQFRCIQEKKSQKKIAIKDSAFFHFLVMMIVIKDYFDFDITLLEYVTINLDAMVLQFVNYHRGDAKQCERNTLTLDP
eukprot:scaffold1955_cov68-Cyclotella_meneghiniana.AAC.5